MPKKHNPSGPGEQPPAEPEQLVQKSRPQEVPDPRKKSDRHKKVTADKWNQ